MEYSESYDKQAQGIPELAYWDNGDLRRAIIQFMAVFSGLQVKVGRLRTNETIDTTDCDGNIVSSEPVFLDPRLITVPIHYGSQDRVVASILADNTQNKLLRLPIMSAYFKGIELRKDWLSGLGAQRRNSYVPSGGLVPDDIQVVHQRRPATWTMTMQLGLYASNTEQHLQMLSQILMLFDPQLQIHVSDGLFDWTKISQLELMSVNMDEVYPALQDRRIIQSTLTFEVVCYLDTPAQVKTNFIKEVFARIGVVSSSDQNSYDIIADLDAQGIDYQAIFTETDLPFN